MSSNLMLGCMGDDEWIISSIDEYLHQLSRRGNVAKSKLGLLCLSGLVGSF